MAFVDFKARKDTQERFRVVHITAWGGDVRINRLGADEVLELIELQEDYEKDDEGNMLNSAEALKFGVEFCARTIANPEGVLQYDDDEGREFLKLEFASVQEVVKAASDLHQLNVSDEDKKKA